MNYKEMAKNAWKRYSEALAKQKTLLSVADPEKGLSDEQASQFDELQKELDKAKGDAERYEQMAKNAEEAEADISEPLPLPVSHDKQSEVLDDGGFKSLSEVVKAVRFGDPRGRLSKEMVGTDQHGENSRGFLVPPMFSSQILALPITGAFVRNYATVIPADSATPDASLTIPMMYYSVNNYGGVVTDWVADEGGEKPETTLKMDQMTLTPYELAAWIPVSDTLLRNSSAAEMLITRQMSSALMNTEQNAFLSGNGAMKPTGIFDSKNTGKVTIAPGTAGKVKYLDIINMRSHMIPESYTSAVWVIDQMYMPDIVGMKDDTGRLIYLDNSIVASGASTLLGRPILWSNANVGVALVDFSAYLIKDGAGVYIAASEHVRFVRNQTIIKIFRLTDGKAWVKTPLKYENGLTLSPYVILGGMGNKGVNPAMGTLAAAGKTK